MVILYRSDFVRLTDGSSGFDIILTELGVERHIRPQVDTVSFYVDKESRYILEDKNGRDITGML